MTGNWNAIAREAGLAAEHLAVGVTALGKANYAFPAYYSQAFFALSVGLERSCKLALIVQHAISNNGVFPPESTVRSYRHDLGMLLLQCDALRITNAYATPALPVGPIHQAIIEILSSFASNVTRYYNIDFLTKGPAGVHADEPMRQWQLRVVNPILRDFCSPKQIQAVRTRADVISALIGNHTMVRHTSEDGSPLETVADASTQTGLTHLTTPFVRLHVLRIARFVAELLGELGTQSQAKRIEDVPYLSEFYMIFMADDAYFKSRKVWSTYPKHPAS
jgi:hypothetical protein